MFLRILNNSIIALVCFCILFMTSMHALSWNDASRFGSIEQWVNNGSFVLNGSIFWETGDKIEIDGQYFSDKPLMLAFVASVPYAIFHYAGGFFFDEHPRMMVYLTNLWMLALPFLLFFLMFDQYTRRHLQAYATREWIRFLVLMLLIGTSLFSYSGQLNNHFPAAITVAIVAIIVYFEQVYSYAMLAFMGFLLSLGGVIDPGVIFVAFCVSIYLLVQLWYEKKEFRLLVKKMSVYITAALIPLLVHAWLTLPVTGDLLPGSMHTEYFDWPGSSFTEESLTGASFAVDSVEAWGTYLWEMLGIANRGLLLHDPLVVIGFLCALGLMIHPQQSKERRYALMAVGATVLMIVYYSLFGKNLSGAAFGVRWFIPFFPLFFPILINYASKDEYLAMIVIILSSVSLLWHVPAFGNVMNGLYTTDEPSMIQAMRSFPERVSEQTQSWRSFVQSDY